MPLAAVRHAELERQRLSSKSGRDAAPQSSPLCVICDAGVEETVAHAMCECAAYQQRRAAAWRSVEAAAAGGGAGGTTGEQWRGMSSEMRARWLLGCGAVGVTVVLHRYLYHLFHTRATIVTTMAKAAAAAAAAADGGAGCGVSARPRMWRRAATAAGLGSGGGRSHGGGLARWR